MQEPVPEVNRLRQGECWRASHLQIFPEEATRWRAWPAAPWTSPACWSGARPLYPAISPLTAESCSLPQHLQLTPAPS